MSRYSMLSFDSLQTIHPGIYRAGKKCTVSCTSSDKRRTAGTQVEREMFATVRVRIL